MVSAKDKYESWKGVNIYLERKYKKLMGTEEVSEPKKEKKIDFDFNNDGKVDKKDLSLASKLMNKSRRKNKK